MVGMAAAASRAWQTAQPAPSIDAVEMFWHWDNKSSPRLWNSATCSVVKRFIITIPSVYNPSSGIAPSASAVHGITCAYNDKGEKCLSKGGIVLLCTPKEEAFYSFFSFVDQARGNKPSVLIGNNARVFDTPRLLYQLPQFDQMMEEAMNKTVYFGDSIPVLKKESWLPKLKLLGTVYQHATQKTFNAHDTLADAQALKEILTD